MSLALMNLSCLIKFSLLAETPSRRRWSVSMLLNQCASVYVCILLVPFSPVHVRAHSSAIESGMCNDGTSQIRWNMKITNKNSHDTAYCWMANREIAVPLLVHSACASLSPFVPSSWIHSELPIHFTLLSTFAIIFAAPRELHRSRHIRIVNYTFLSAYYSLYYYY